MKIPAILMAGGKNSRFNFRKINQKTKEKLLLPLGENYIIDYSIKAALNSNHISQLIIASSPNAKCTYEYIKEKYQNLLIIETEGKGYIQDIRLVVNKLNLAEVLIMVGDVPFITSEILGNIIKSYFNLKCEALSVIIPIKSYQKYGFNVPLKYFFVENGEKVIFAGFNVIDGRLINQNQMSQVNIIIEDVKIMYNINTVEDYNQAKEYYKILKKIRVL